jgi:protein gp37
LRENNVGKKTKIPWCDHTFNIVWGCVEVSPECANCYARTMSRAWGPNLWGKEAPRKIFGTKYWEDPLKWNAEAAAEGRRHRVFCSDMADVFEDHPTVAQERAKLWPLIRQTPWLDWLLLTKRADRIATCLPADWGSGWPNVWLGVTVGHSSTVWRADHLRVIPAVVRFVSAEPLLTPLPNLDLEGIDWLIVGGESGPDSKRREMDPQWARDLRDRCSAAGVAFFFKQISHRQPDQGDLDGERIREFPTPRAVGAFS